MKIFNHKYNGHSITFDFSEDQDVMMNATEMAKIFGKGVHAFMRNKNTQKFIETCLRSEFANDLKIKSINDLVVSKQKTGTRMHRILALKFAAWLDPGHSFELWVYSMLEEIRVETYQFKDRAKIIRQKPLIMN